jgi:hypothetical protein
MKSDGEIYLDRLDRITGTKATFTKISQPEDQPAIHVAIYRGFPSRDLVTAFTIGLSLTPPSGATHWHPELVITMRSPDTVWALAMGELAYRLRGVCSFSPRETFDFGAEISPESRMSAFFSDIPSVVSPSDACIAVSQFRIHLVQLYPIFACELAALRERGIENMNRLFGPESLLDPFRPAIQIA